LNAALAHMPEFAEAFQCRKRDNTCFWFDKNCVGFLIWRKKIKFYLFS
jgi:hypothetical protein